MPGPVSDSYDPEYGTSANRHDVLDAINAVTARLTKILGDERKSIVGVVQGKPGKRRGMIFSEQEMRVIRYCLDITKNIS